MNDDIERRLRAFGAAVDTAGEELLRRRAAGEPTAPVVDIQAVRPTEATLRARRRFRRVLAAAAAVAVVASGATAITIASRQRDEPRPELGAALGAPAVVASSEPATTEAPVTRQPATTEPATTEPATTQPATTEPAPPVQPAEPADDGAETSGRAPVCPSYQTQVTYHFELCDAGPFVQLIQQRLRATVAPGLDDDGYFGPTTERAVREFQQQRGLTVDGQVGPETWELLLPDLPGVDSNGNGFIDPNEVAAG